MALLTVQDAPVTGLAGVTFQAADAGGDTVPATAGAVLLVRNGSAGNRLVTVDTPGTVEGLDIENPVVTIAAADIGAVPLVGRVFGATVSVTYDAVASTDVAAIRPAR